MLVVPDVHGREFWVDPISQFPNEEAIFLGDYLDPYSEEGITKEDAIRVFKEILNLKKENPSRITLLLGNHDFMYFSKPFMINPCRHDWDHHQEIRNLFIENFDSFSLVESRGNYIFSHSGIHPEWLKKHPEFGDSIKSSVKILNSKILDSHLADCLNEFSWWRGGDIDCSFGSPVWSDVREWVECPPSSSEEITQIFGHTQLREGKIIKQPGFACIDCKRIIKIDENNKLEIL